MRRSARARRAPERLDTGGDDMALQQVRAARLPWSGPSAACGTAIAHEASRMVTVTFSSCSLLESCVHLRQQSLAAWLLPPSPCCGCRAMLLEIRSNTPFAARFR